MEKRKLIRELQSHQSVLKEKAQEKARESVSAVFPIVLIVLILGFTVAALSPGILVEFLVGSVLVILGLLYHTEGNVALEVISEVENSIAGTIVFSLPVTSTAGLRILENEEENS